MDCTGARDRSTGSDRVPPRGVVGGAATRGADLASRTSAAVSDADAARAAAARIGAVIDCVFDGAFEHAAEPSRFSEAAEPALTAQSVVIVLVDERTRPRVVTSRAWVRS